MKVKADEDEGCNKVKGVEVKYPNVKLFNIDT